MRDNIILKIVSAIVFLIISICSLVVAAQKGVYEVCLVGLISYGVANISWMIEVLWNKNNIK